MYIYNYIQYINNFYIHFQIIPIVTILAKFQYIAKNAHNIYIKISLNEHFRDQYKKKDCHVSTITLKLRKSLARYSGRKSSSTWTNTFASHRESMRKILGNVPHLGT